MINLLKKQQKYQIIDSEKEVVVKGFTTMMKANKHIKYLKNICYALKKEKLKVIKQP